MCFYRGLAGLLAFSLLLGACSPNVALSYEPLTSDRPFVQLVEGLSVSANPASLGADFGVNLRAIPTEALANGNSGDAVAEAAHAARLPSLTQRSPLFRLSQNGNAPEQLFLSLVAPAGTDADQLDVYAWDGTAWRFLPSQARGGQRVAAVNRLPQAVALFEAVPPSPLTAILIEPGDLWPLNTVATGSQLLLGGITAEGSGAFSGVLPNLPPGISDPLFPIVRADLARTPALLDDPALRIVHLRNLLGLAGSYAGLTLDYRNLAAGQRDSFTTLVSELQTQLRAQNKVLWLMLDAPTDPNNTGGYDWAALGAAAEGIIMRLPNDPRALGNGSADLLLAWATGQVERSRLRLATSARVMSSSAGRVTPVDAEVAFGALGSVTLGDAQLPVGQPITLILAGQAQALDFDPEAFAPRLTTPDATFWLPTAATLRRRFALAEKHRLGGVVAEDLFRAGTPIEMLAALGDYRNGVPANATPESVTLTWTVSDANGVIAQAMTQPGEAFVFTPPQAGDHQAVVQLQLGAAQRVLGSVPLQVMAAPALAPIARPRPGGNAGSRGNTGGNTGSNNPGGSNTGGGTSGGFVPPPPVTSSTFELGGQVPGVIAHPALMKQAGMRWVKFQVRSGGGDYIAAARANGFKVLLSVIGDKNRATDPSYWNEYAGWVAGLAAQGADAIEVWNEPNIDHEWPEGQISGATYTQLLAKAYGAIKAANPGTLVISGGPAPTGAEAAFPGRVMNDDKFLAQMAAAGAANYMDCVGVHYNSGTTSPNATTGSTLGGYHYSFYFWPMVDVYWNAFGGSRPLCFTELGYLTPEGYGPLPPHFAWAANTTVAQQAQWLAESASLAAASGKVRLMIIWNVDFTYWSGDPQAGYAIVRPGGTCPACAALDAVMP
ncbi:MAG: hypothetical protein NZM11_06185 [Anaerolineales bacterium]|nr:hypothetical protein [Anaerolineales bacterium]